MIGELISTYFYYKKTDKTIDAVSQIADNIEGKMRSLIASAFSGLAVQQLDLLNNSSLLLHNFKIVYEAEMEKTVEKIDEVAQRHLGQIDSMAHGWIEGVTGPKVQNFLLEGKAMLMATPFMKKTPILTGVFPTFVSPFEKKTHITITCIGHFPDAGHPSLTPTLELRDQKIEPIKNFGQLEFAVPYSFLFPEGNQPLIMVSYDIKFPCVKEGFLWNTTSFRVYKNWMSLLPTSAGKITLEYIQVSEAKEEKWIPKTCFQSSRKHSQGGENCDIIDRPHTVKADPGWSILPGSVSVHMGSGAIEGEGTTYKLVSEGPLVVIVTATTRKHRRNHKSGKIGFDIRATQFRVNKVFEEKREELNLNWGDSLAIDPSKKNWKVIFDAFDGTRKEYTGNVDDSFISITSPGGTPVLTVKPPQAIPSDVAQPEQLLAKL